MKRVAVMALAFLVPRSAVGQGYRAALDFQGQAVAFRGVTLDSVPQSETMVGRGGGRYSAEGFAVSCSDSNGFCYFYRPGPVEHAGPVAATLEGTAWGFRLPGLSLHGIARVTGDLGSANVWPGTTPQGQLLEGYAQYATPAVTAQAGRMENLCRLGAIGYDGIHIIGRKEGFELTGYGGFGLARATAIPISSPVLNPLDQYQPRRRQWVAGLSAGWSPVYGSVRLMYQREIDRTTRGFVSERAGADLVLRPPVRGVRASGGFDYDLAAGVWGSAEGSVTFARGPVALAGGARRYRPQFDLWTIWGAFSPVPYHAFNGSLRFAPIRHVALYARGERYHFDPTEADAPLADYRNDGWRWSGTVDLTPLEPIALSGTIRRESGPGASSRGFEGSASWHRGEQVWISVQGASLERPLEFRFNDAKVWMVGARASARVTPRVSISAGAAHYGENRDRSDAAAFDWNQNRFDVRVRFLFGPGADQAPLPPALPSVR